ncbi:hypothetical protein [Actinoplanes sp. G11-F43]|uniref:hypothetical protein n=1 Tax=Actinoplanes sp. G11-F43 TaxID=3424130 RepID=UPI003D332810
MTRVFGIELRRSAAPGAALMIAGLGALLLYLAAESAIGGWMHLAMGQRLFLAVLWPLALAAGAWQASRERRAKVSELFTTTPRPPVQRAVPVLAAMAVAVTCGYLVMAGAGAIPFATTAGYLPAASLAVTAVGVLSLIAAVWLGLAVGRALPWPLTAPALAIAGLALLLTIPMMTRPHGWLALVFSPIYEMNLPGAWATVPGRVSTAQAIWLGALALSGLLWFAASGRPARIAAVLPAVLGAALAITVMPHQNRQVLDAIDPVARELVCTTDAPRVCVSRVHAGMLSEVTGPAREGLSLLARVPGAPTRVHEDTTIYYPENYPQWSDDAVPLRLETLPGTAPTAPGDLVPEVVAGAFASPPTCAEDYAPMADRYAAAYWLLDREPSGERAESAEIWFALTRLPAEEALAKVADLRRAALACTASGGLLGEVSR